MDMSGVLCSCFGWPCRGSGNELSENEEQRDERDPGP